MKKLFEGKVKLEKIPGKGGWTYAALPSSLTPSKSKFGMIRVKGSIDGFPIEQYNLMPMGDGRLFLPVKKAIRKAIAKEAGATVFIEMYSDDSPVVIPKYIEECLSEDPVIFNGFLQKSLGFQKNYISKIEKAKSEDVRASLIAQLIDKLYLEIAEK